jgi:hypothetical protein
MNGFLIAYVIILVGLLIFLIFKKSKDKFSVFDIYTRHENDRALKNWKFRRLSKNNFRNYNYQNF